MHIFGQLRAMVGAIPRCFVRRQLHRFLADSARCQQTQQQVLRNLLKLNADSRFGQAHRLDQIRTPEEFRRCLPVADYEAHREHIDRVKVGDHRALLGSNNPLLMFTLSSGTTSDSKYIPITKQFLSDYRRGWQIWGIQVLDDHVPVNTRSMVQISSDYDRFRSQGGTPCGNISGLVAAMQKRIVRSMYAVPGAVAKITDPDAKNYTALRLSLADKHVSMITTANPSTLIHLARCANEWKTDLIRDIHDGTLSTRFDVPKSVRETLKWSLRRKKTMRSHALDRIAEQQGVLYPKDYWKDLTLLAVWTGGSAGAFLNLLPKFYGEVPVRDHGLSASEGRMTIPLWDGHAPGVLDITSHYFEFIPEEEYGKEGATVLEAHELQPDCNYYILLTTASGLYRYDICDVVRCTGFFNGTPLLRFLHKGAHIANLTGEKVSESQIVSAVQYSSQRLHMCLDRYTVAPVWGDPPHYQILAEENAQLQPGVGLALAVAVDQQLQRLNIEYREKRQSGRLNPMSWRPLPAGAWDGYARKYLNKLGGSFEQYKHPCLVPHLDFVDKLLSATQDAAQRAA